MLLDHTLQLEQTHMRTRSSAVVQLGPSHETSLSYSVMTCSAGFVLLADMQLGHTTTRTNSAHLALLLCSEAESLLSAGRLTD